MEATTAVQVEMEQMVTSMVVWSEALQATVMAAMLAPEIEAVATAPRRRPRHRHLRLSSTAPP